MNILAPLKRILHLSVLLLLGLLPTLSWSGDLTSKLRDCKALVEPTSRLACFEVVVSDLTIKKQTIQKWTEQIAVLSLPFITRTWAAAEADANAQRGVAFYVRQNSSLDAENKKGAKFSVARSGGDSALVVNGAVIFAPYGLDLEDVESLTPYASFGLRRDNRDPNAVVATNDARVGFRQILAKRPKNADGTRLIYGLSVAHLRDETSHRQTVQVEYSLDGSRRWVKFDHTGDDPQLLSDRILSYSLKPYFDRVVRDAQGKSGTERGVQLAVGLRIAKPVDFLMAPDTFFWESQRAKQLSGTRQQLSGHQVGLIWDIEKSNTTSLSKRSITLTRSVGGDFRSGELPVNKTTLEGSWKFQ